MENERRDHRCIPSPVHCVYSASLQWQQVFAFPSFAPVFFSAPLQSARSSPRSFPRHHHHHWHSPLLYYHDFRAECWIAYYCYSAPPPPDPHPRSLCLCYSVTLQSPVVADCAPLCCRDGGREAQRERGGDDRMGGVFGEGSGGMNSEWGAVEEEGGTGWGGHFLHPLAFIPAVPLVFPFLLSSAAWDARIPVSIGQYVSARLIQVDVSTERSSFVSKTFPITHFSAFLPSLSSLLSHAVPCERFPFPHGGRHKNQHTLSIPPHAIVVPPLMSFWPRFQRLGWVIWVHCF